MRVWCERVSAKTGSVWRYKRIDQAQFESRAASTLADLLDGK